MLVVAIILTMLTLMFFGMPVAVVLGITGVFGIFYLNGWNSAFGILTTVPFRSVASITMMAIPMFILMAEFISRSKIIEEVFTATQRWLERVPGGLAIATIIASAGMGAMCGSSAASAATMAKVSVPELIKYGYKPYLSAGLVAVSGTLAIMIPPSLSFIIYGSVTEVSIGKLLIAGIIPGLLTAAMYSAGILIWNKVQPGIMPPPTHNFTSRQRWDSLKPLWAFVILIVIVIGAIYSGIGTATEAASVGAFGALIIGLLMRRLKKEDIGQSCVSTIQTSTMILTIVVGAMIFGYLLTMTQTPQKIIQLVQVMDINRWVVMGFIILIYLVLGCLMESSSILLITLPLTFPLITSLGFDPIWFGVICIKLIEIGLVTPPVGVNCYIVSAATDVPLTEVFRGTGMMLAIEVITLFILLLFPVLSTWLPSLMIG